MSRVLEGDRGGGEEGGVSEHERGFVVILRKIRWSALWRSLRADQKGVLVTLLLLANWGTKKARWKDTWFDVGRGELYHSLETIAAESGCTVKVVRTTLVILMADDRPLGGNGPFLSEKYPILGTGPGTGPRVLSIVNYDKYQDVRSEPGTDSGTDRARVGQRENHSNQNNQLLNPLTPFDCEQWTQLLAEAAANGYPDAAEHLGRSVAEAKVRDQALSLVPVDEYGAAYLRDHAAGLEQAARERFGLSLRLEEP
jgi:hypothetical protein